MTLDAFPGAQMGTIINIIIASLGYGTRAEKAAFVYINLDLSHLIIGEAKEQSHSLLFFFRDSRHSCVII
jgi:hypothetical protein